MTISVFQQLGFNEKTEILRHAVCLSGKSEGDSLYLLYQVDSFYVEVQYHKVHHFILTVDAFDDMNRLDPYLEKIEIYIPA